METKKYSLSEKKQMLVHFIEMQVALGYDITPFIGKPLSYFDFDKLAAAIITKEEEYYK